MVIRSKPVSIGIFRAFFWTVSGKHEILDPDVSGQKEPFKSERRALELQTRSEFQSNLRSPEQVPE